MQAYSKRMQFSILLQISKNGKISYHDVAASRSTDKAGANRGGGLVQRAHVPRVLVVINYALVVESSGGERSADPRGDDNTSIRRYRSTASCTDGGQHYYFF